MNKKDFKINKPFLYVAAFIIPVIMMIIVSACLGMYPFGDRTILVSDLNAQFIDYYSYFKSIFTTNNDFIYTFSKNLGGDMIGFSGYYLQNPFHFLFTLVSENWMPVAVLFIITIEIGISGLCFSVYLNHLYKPRYASLIFSTAYAFMGYIFAYITLPIYLLNIAILPLALLGIHKLIKNPKDRWLYVITLAASIFFNYYMGFMLCLFSVIFFVYLLLMEMKSIRNIKDYSKVILSYIASSILAVGLMAFDIIPIALSLGGQKSIPSPSSLSFYRNFRMIDVFSRFYSNSFDGNISNDNLPFIFVGMAVIVFVLLYFFNEKIKLKEKFLSAGVIAVVLICMYIHTIDVIWHGFNEPVGFAYRYAYFVSFLLIAVAYRGFVHFRDGNNGRHILFLAGIYVLYSTYMILSQNASVGFKEIAYDFILIAIIAGGAYLLLIGKCREAVFLALLCGVQLINLVTNAITSIDGYPAHTLTEFRDYRNKVEPIVQYIKDRDNSFYRIEKNFERTHNDSMQFNYSGLSHSSSCEKDYVKEFIAKMGFRNFGLWAFYNNGGTAFADSFLGVKYFVSKYTDTGKGYAIIAHDDKSYIFENPYVLPLAFGVSGKIRDTDMSTTDLFQIQNDIASAFARERSEIYLKEKNVKEVLTNLTMTEEGGTKVYQKINSDAEAYIEYQITMSHKDNLYLYFNAPEIQGAALFVNDYPYDDYFTNYRWDMVDIGSYEKGSTVAVKMTVKGDSLKLYDYLFYYEDLEALKQWHETSEIDKGNLQKETSSHLKGSINVKGNSEYLMFTIPFEKDWSIYIDGVKTEQIMVLDALMAVPISEGEHQIEMRYIPVGWYSGIPLTAAALIGTVLIILKEKKKKRA